MKISFDGVGGEMPGTFSIMSESQEEYAVLRCFMRRMETDCTVSVGQTRYHVGLPANCQSMSIQIGLCKKVSKD